MRTVNMSDELWDEWQAQSAVLERVRAAVSGGYTMEDAVIQVRIALGIEQAPSRAELDAGWADLHRKIDEEPPPAPPGGKLPP